MKLAIGIITLVLMVVFGVESFSIHAGALLAGNAIHAKGALDGLVVAFLFLIAGAFAFTKPFVAFAVFILALAQCIYTIGATDYVSADFYGIASLVLAILSFFAWRSDRKNSRPTTE